MLKEEVTADIVAVDIKRWSKTIRFEITFPLTTLRAELEQLKPNSGSTLSFRTVDYINKTKYAELDNDLKFNVSVYFEGPETVTFFFLPTEKVYLVCFYIHLSLNSHIKWPSLAFSYPNTNYDPNKWYEVPILELGGQIFRKTLNQHVENGKLCFVAEIKIQNDGLKKSVPKKDIMIEQPSSLTEDLNILLNDSTLSDVTVKSVDGAAFPAHKLILSARCAVFKAHFEHGTKESSTAVIETMFETEVLQELLHYIYTDTAPKCDTMEIKLLAAADYYQLNRLKSLCEKAMLSKLTVENAVETLVQADLYSANNVKELVLEFINKGENRTAVFKTDGWKTLQSAELLRLLYEGSLQ